MLCSFAIPRVGRNFLIYSLDEEARSEYSRVYIATLHKQGDNDYSLGTLDSEFDWQSAIQVFRQIVREVAQ
ncbi:hypothetical protein D9M68_620430 [compost metagenome]